MLMMQKYRFLSDYDHNFLEKSGFEIDLSVVGLGINYLDLQWLSKILLLRIYLMKMGLDY